MHYVGIIISTHQFIPCYVSIYTNSRILKPFEDSVSTGLKVDIAQDSISNQVAAKAAQRVTLLLQQTPPVKKFNIAYDAHNTSQDSINSQVVVKAKLRGTLLL